MFVFHLFHKESKLYYEKVKVNIYREMEMFLWQNWIFLIKAPISRAQM